MSSRRASPRIPHDVPQPVRPRRIGVRVKHLEYLRHLPCIGCGREPAGEAMHVRLSDARFQKYNTMSRTPENRYALPGCGQCHRGDQHTKEGERGFWSRLGIDPLDVSLALWAVSGDLEKGQSIIFKARQRIALHQRQGETTQ